MALPTYVGAGAKAAAAGAAVTPALPGSLLVGDILFLVAESMLNESVTVPTPNGGVWTQLPDSPQDPGTSTGTRLTVFWSRYNGVQTAPTTNAPANHICAGIVAFRGCEFAAVPYDVTSGGTETASDTSMSIPGDTTTVNDCLIVMMCASGVDSNTDQFTNAWSNASLGSVTKRIGYQTTSGNGGGFGLATGTLATAGTYGATTTTLVTASVKGMMTVALRPPTRTFPSQSVLDNFTGSDANPITGNWSVPVKTGDANVKRVSNALTNEFQGGEGSGNWNATSFGADQEVWATLATKPADNDQIRLYLRLANVGGTVPDGYEVRLTPSSGTDVVAIFRMDDGGSTQLGNGVAVEFSSGDSLGGLVIGNDIFAFRKSAGTWTLILIASDTTYTLGGYIGVKFSQSSATAPVIDDFGGGTWGASGTAHSLTPADTITLSDVAGQGVGLGKADTITLSDATSRVWVAFTSFADTITLSDLAAKTVGKPAADTITLSDNMVAQIILILQLSDTITLSDVVAKSAGLNPTDTVSLSDQFARAWAAVRSLADSVTMSDAVAKAIGTALADTIGTSDALGKADALTTADTVTLADAIARSTGLSQADAITLADSIGKGLGLLPADTVTLSDAESRAFGLLRADTITLSDVATPVLTPEGGLSLNLADTITLTDTIVKTLALSRADVVGMVDDIARALNGQFLGMGVGDEVRTILLDRFGIY